MRTIRAVLLKKDKPENFCEVGIAEGSDEPFEFVILIDELYIRQRVSDHHGADGRIPAYVYHPHYEI